MTKAPPPNNIKVRNFATNLMIILAIASIMFSTSSPRGQRPSFLFHASILTCDQPARRRSERKSFRRCEANLRSLLRRRPSRKTIAPPPSHRLGARQNGDDHDTERGKETCADHWRNPLGKDAHRMPCPLARNGIRLLLDAVQYRPRKSHEVHAKMTIGEYPLPQRNGRPDPIVYCYGILSSTAPESRLRFVGEALLDGIHYRDVKCLPVRPRIAIRRCPNAVWRFCEAPLLD